MSSSGALNGLFQGMAKGVMLRQALEHQRLQDQLTQQELKRQQQSDAMKMISDRANLMMMGAKEGTNGIVQDMLGTGSDQKDTSAPSYAPPTQETPDAGAGSSLDQLRAMSAPQPAMTAQPANPGAPAIVAGQPTAQGTLARKMDKSRTVTIPWIDGKSIDYELPTPEEQLQRQAYLQQAQQMRTAVGAAQADTAAKQFVLKMRGQKLDDDTAKTLGIDNSNPWALFLPEELPGLKAKAAEIKKSNIHDVGPGHSLLDTSGYATNGQEGNGMRLIASGGPPPPTGDFEKVWLPKVAATLKNADGTPKTVGQMTTEEVAKAAGQWKEANADPETRAANIAAKNAALATASLSNILKRIQIDQAPKPEDAAMIADDIRNHRLAPDQFTTIRGRGNGGLGIMVEREMKKSDPTFNWEQAASEYNLAKSPQFQNTVRYMDSVQESIPMVIQRAKELANGNIRGINALVNAGRNQFNGIDLKKFNTDRILVADEIAKILQGGGSGGGTSDMKLKQAGEILQSSDSPQAIAAALSDVQQLIGFRRKALTRGTYLENAQPTAGGPSGAHEYLHTATGQNGQKIGTDDGKTWVDIATGRPVGQ